MGVGRTEESKVTSSSAAVFDYVICGGGRHNPAMMREIRGLLEPLGERVVTAEDLDLNGDSMEAEAWAYLAVRSLRGLPLTFPGTTGISQPMTGGVLSLP